MQANVQPFPLSVPLAADRARSAVVAFAEKKPADLVRNLLANPCLAKELTDWPDIVEILIERGQADQLRTLLDSRSLGMTSRARRVLVEKLVTMPI